MERSERYTDRESALPTRPPSDERPGLIPLLRSPSEYPPTLTEGLAPAAAPPKETATRLAPDEDLPSVRARRHSRCWCPAIRCPASSSYSHSQRPNVAAS